MTYHSTIFYPLFAIRHHDGLSHRHPPVAAECTIDTVCYLASERHGLLFEGLSDEDQRVVLRAVAGEYQAFEITTDVSGSKPRVREVMKMMGVGRRTGIDPDESPAKRPRAEGIEQAAK